MLWVYNFITHNLLCKEVMIKVADFVVVLALFFSLPQSLVNRVEPSSYFLMFQSDNSVPTTNYGVFHWKNCIPFQGQASVYTSLVLLNCFCSMILENCSSLDLSHAQSNSLKPINWLEKWLEVVLMQIKFQACLGIIHFLWPT